MKIYNKRSDIPEKYKWDLEAILKNKPPVFYFNKIKKAGKYLVENNDKFLNSLEEFKEYIGYSEKFYSNKIIYLNWLDNNISMNLTDDKFRKLTEEFHYWEQKFLQDNADINNHIIKNKKIVINYLKNSQFKNYDLYFQRIFDKKKHLLSKKEEILFNTLQRAVSNSEVQFSILRDSEITFNPVVDSNGKSHKLTRGNFINFLESKDSVIRKKNF